MKRVEENLGSIGASKVFFFFFNSTLYSQFTAFIFSLSVFILILTMEL